MRLTFCIKCRYEINCAKNRAQWFEFLDRHPDKKKEDDKIPKKQQRESSESNKHGLEQLLAK